MSYWTFRLNVYRYALKQWLLTVKQIGFGLVALFPMALPALFLIILLAYGIIAEPDTPNKPYFATLWGYVLVTYSWVYLQKDGILARSYHYFDSSLPVDPLLRRWVDRVLVIYAANMLLIGPPVMLLLAISKHISAFINQPVMVTVDQLIPLLSLLLLAFYYAFKALRGRFPWLSLLVVPLTSLHLSAALPKWGLLVLFTLAIAIENTLKVTALSIKPVPSNRLWLYGYADLATPSKNLLRLVGAIVVLILAFVFIGQVDREVKHAAASFFSLLLGVLMGSKLLDIEKLNDDFEYYLSSMPENKWHKHLQGLVYCVMYTIPVMLMIGWFGIFDLVHWAYFAIFVLSSYLGILTVRNNFLLFPGIAVLAVWLASLFTGK